MAFNMGGIENLLYDWKIGRFICQCCANAEGLCYGKRTAFAGRVGNSDR